jgi:hypothetical protein
LPVLHRLPSYSGQHDDQPSADSKSVEIGPKRREDAYAKQAGASKNNGDGDRRRHGHVLTVQLGIGGR